MRSINIHPLPGYDLSLSPVAAEKHKQWWQDNDKTRNHAQHCLPLAMANSVGYYILSPATFTVEWAGDIQTDAHITIIDGTAGCDVDNHAAFGSFTIQPGFIVTTDNPGDFVYIKGIPNERGAPFNCMEALIEAWWSLARFGLVFLLNQPGKFMIAKGQPIAQMMLFRADGGFTELYVRDLPEQYSSWTEKRSRPDYKKDLDYMRGRYPDGTPESTHISSWR